MSARASALLSGAKMSVFYLRRRNDAGRRKNNTKAKNREKEKRGSKTLTLVAVAAHGGLSCVL